jgi:hypothetical protein
MNQEDSRKTAKSSSDQSGATGKAAQPASSNRTPAQNSTVKQVILPMLNDWYRTGYSSIKDCHTFKFHYYVEQEFEPSIAQFENRAYWRLVPFDGSPTPTKGESYGTTEGLFSRLQQAIVEQAGVSEDCSALLTFWTISTWFSDALSLAPGLAIVGPPHEGDRLLRTLTNFCRNPLLLWRANLAPMKRAEWETTRTLLFFDPCLTRQMAAMLGCTTRPGYRLGYNAGDQQRYRDFFGPKAVYLGEQVSADRIPRCSLVVNLSPTTGSPTEREAQSHELVMQQLQNQLLYYRLRNLLHAYNSDFRASELTSDTAAIANALGTCIVDAPELQAKLISLLTPVEDQQKTDRSTGIEGTTIEATLNLCHRGKDQILVGEIATEVNALAKQRSERLTYSAEKIGHTLKRLGLSTRRLGKAGKGLLMDPVTISRLHDLAAMHGGAGLDACETNLNCPLCATKK